MDKVNLLEELNKSKKYQYAFMTSFNFEINFFESMIMPKFVRNGINKVSLFIDSKEFNKSIKDIRNSSLGNKYIVNPIEMQGAFHPKMILLLFYDKAKLFVSSSNITSNGYFNNNEIFNVYEYDKDNLNDLNLIIEAYNMFKYFNEISYNLENNLFKEIDQTILFLKSKNLKGDKYLLTNIKDNLINQVVNLIDEKITQIDIAVPYYDNYLHALDEIERIYQTNNVNLYIQNYKSKFPVELYNKNHKENIKIFNKILINSSSAFYHGKVIRFKGISKSYIIYGSANCTESALLKRFSDNGNIECDVFESGSLDKFDDFFNNFMIEENQEIKCDSLVYESNVEKNYFYKYGIIDKSAILYIGFIKKNENIKILLKNKELDYEIKAGLIQVKINAEILRELDDVFNINIVDDNVNEEITCWCINRITLENNRNNISELEMNLDIDLSDDISYEKFINQRKELLMATSFTKEEINREVSLINAFDNSQEDDFDNVDYEVNEENLETGIIDLDVYSFDDMKEYKRYKYIEKVYNEYFNKYYIQFGKLENEDKSCLSNDKNTSNNPKGNNIPRKPTTYESDFERYARRIINHFLVSDAIIKLTAKNYLNRIVLLYDILDRYSLENIEGIFSNVDIADYKYRLLSNLFTMNLGGLDNEVIYIVLKTILDNHLVKRELCSNDDRRIEQNNKDLLLKLNNKYNLREDYEQYIFNISSNLGYDYISSIEYLEELFGFKTDKKLLEYLKEKLGENVIVIANDSKYIIEFESSKINLYFNYSTSILKEISKEIKSNLESNNMYCDTIEFNIKNTKVYNDKIDNIELLVVKVSWNLLKNKVEAVRKSGRLEKW